MRNRNIIIMLVSVLAFIAIVGGVSYSYFIYNKDIADASIDMGDISLNFSNASSSLNNVTMTPINDNLGKLSDSYIDFTVNGTVDTERVYYEVYIVPKDNSTMTSANINDYVKVYLTDQSNVMVKNPRLYKNLGNSSKNNGKIIYQAIIEQNNNGTTKNETKNLRLRVWLDENYQSTQNETLNFSIYLYAMNVDENFTIPEVGSVMINRSIQAKTTAGTCTPSWTDSADNIVYLSGDNTCIDFNYVWYSGKLWRIVAIYSDGAMKMVTQNNITSITYNDSGGSFYTNPSTTSFVYQWLNEDFYDTLYNFENIVDTTKNWNYTSASSISTKPSETNTINAKVGLLNNYEYYNSYRNNSYSTGYLNIKYIWWLLNIQSSQDVWAVNGGGSGYSTSANTAYGIRPAIIVKSGIELSGIGTSSNPYRIVGDKGIGNINDNVNTRTSGEYIKLKNNNNEQLFRIIGIENNKTKIIAMDYIDSSTRRKFATSSDDVLWGSGTTLNTNTWYTYLNNTYYSNLTSTYGDIFDSNIYYYGTSEYNYKLSVCASATGGNTKNCTKTSQANTLNIGLARYGEMFATQQAGGSSTSIYMWLLNPNASLYASGVNGYGCKTQATSTDEYVARPTVHLKSTVKIKSGSGTYDDPYVVGL